MARPLHPSLFVLGLALTVLLGAGCGGGGGGGGNSGGSTGTTGTPFAAVLVRPVGLVSGTTVAHDLSNTVAGEILVVQGVAVDVTGAGQLVTLTNLSTTAPSAVATLSGGVLTAVAASANTYTVSGKYGGTTYSANLNVSDPSARVSETGYARTLTGTAVAGATVRFYANGSTTQIATAVVGADGFYQANLPLSATRFTIDVSALKSSTASLYYNTFSYGLDSSGNPVYYIGDASCTSPLPAPLGGTVPESVFFSRSTSGTPPPAPDGCTGS